MYVSVGALAPLLSHARVEHVDEERVHRRRRRPAGTSSSLAGGVDDPPTAWLIIECDAVSHPLPRPPARRSPTRVL